MAGSRRPDSQHGFVLSKDVQRALLARRPVVALESAVITHGLPFPQNLEAAQEMETIVAVEGAAPATVAVIGGAIRVGLGADEIRDLAQSRTTRKIGLRDFTSAALAGSDGGTTVAATLFVAARAGIEVFATGGIGGVHRESAFDVSADLTALGRTPMIVVCAGAKAILDLRATLEVLENLSVPVLGYGTDEFPAFFSPLSGLPVSARVDSPDEVAQYWQRHCALGMTNAVLVTNPIPSAAAIPMQELDGMIQRASGTARDEGVRGPSLTPFLLDQIGRLSAGRSIQANRSLLANNARLAARIAVAIAILHQDKEIPK